MENVNAGGEASCAHFQKAMPPEQEAFPSRNCYVYGCVAEVPVPAPFVDGGGPAVASSSELLSTTASGSGGEGPGGGGGWEDPFFRGLAYTNSHTKSI